MTSGWRYRALLGALVIVLLPVDDTAATDPRCSPETALRACDGGDRYECEWGRLMAGRGSVASLARLIDGTPGDLDTLLRRLFPAIGDKPIVDAPLPVPEGLIFESANYPAYAIPVPVDWSADPFSNPTWRYRFQSLSWFHEYWDGDAARLEVGAALLADWVERALYASPPLDQTWEDAAIAIRLDRAVQLTERYIAARPTLDRRYLHAAAQLVATHLYALAARCCYSRKHNHGVMQDLAILNSVKKYPGLRHVDELFDHAGARLIGRQLRYAVASDGVHVENSGCYHRLFVTLLDSVLVAYRDAGEAPPDELVEMRDSMLEPLVQHLQPDGTFAQFGDCSDENQARRLRFLLEEIRELGSGDPAATAPLEWVITHGKLGTMPDTHRVYELGGYAMFRDGWTPQSTAAHVKLGHLSPVHYHADETSFEIFAHGHPLLVGPGAFTYADDDPLYAYQRSPAAHNVLVVDDDPTVEAHRKDAKVVAHGQEGGVSWVQGSHGNYRRLGVSLVRTFAFVRPDTFVVVDHVRADREHDYAQHFHFPPEVGEVEAAGDRAARASVAAGPSLTITSALAPRAIETPESWHFPSLGKKERAREVVLRHTARTTDLALVIVVTAPGRPARFAEEVMYAEDGDVATVSWRLDGVTHRLQVPAR